MDSRASRSCETASVLPVSGNALARVRRVLRLLGSGVVTGAADDDPSGIATYSPVGAQFGFSMLWTILFIYPFMAAIQEISARLGRVTGRGIAGNIRNFYSSRFLYGIIGLLLFANVVNIGADIAATGSAANLLAGGPVLLYCILFTAVSVLLQIFVPYKTYSRFLKWLTLSLFAYVGTVFVVRIHWAEALRGSFVPNLSLKREYMAALIAVLGTTISPYLFFWQSAEEVEKMDSAPKEKPLKAAPGQASSHLHRIKVDTYIGMAFSNLISYSIILTVAATLHANGKTDINSAAQAAEALRPVAGPLASLLFSLGILGTGLLAVPVLGGSAAYAVGEALGWPVGMERKAHEAKAYYAVLAFATLIGLGLNFIGIDPIRALVWSAIINGMIAAPVMGLMMLLASNRRVMGGLILPVYLKVLGWAGAAAMALAAIGVFVTAGK